MESQFYGCFHIHWLKMHYCNSNNDWLVSEWCYWKCPLQVIFSKPIGSLKWQTFPKTIFEENAVHVSMENSIEDFSWFVSRHHNVFFFSPKAKNFMLPKGAEILHVVKSYSFSETQSHLYPGMIIHNSIFINFYM